MRLDLKTKMRLLLILAPFGVIMLLALTFYIMDQEFRRVAPEEMAARSWLSERGAQITKGGRGRFGLHIIGVDFSNMNLVDGDMWGLSQELASLSELKTLQLSGTRISDQGLKYLCDLSSLESLDLSRTNISDTGLAELTRLPNLEYLDVSYTKVTQEGIRALTNARFPKLKTVAHDGVGEGK